MYELIKKDGRAKRGRLTTVHGVIETPVFMNVGTVAAIKGAVSTDDLREIGTQVELSNTYHLHVRTGDKLIKEFGGLHKFMNWDRPILADFKYFLWQNSARSKKKEYLSPLISMEERSLWDQKKVCRSSPILGLRLRWHLMSVRHILQQENICRIL